MGSNTRALQLLKPEYYERLKFADQFLTENPAAAYIQNLQKLVPTIIHSPQLTSREKMHRYEQVMNKLRALVSQPYNEQLKKIEREVQVDAQDLKETNQTSPINFSFNQPEPISTEETSEDLEELLPDQNVIIDRVASNFRSTERKAKARNIASKILSLKGLQIDPNYNININGKQTNINLFDYVKKTILKKRPLLDLQKELGIDISTAKLMDINQETEPQPVYYWMHSPKIQRQLIPREAKTKAKRLHRLQAKKSRHSQL